MPAAYIRQPHRIHFFDRSSNSPERDSSGCPASHSWRWRRYRFRGISGQILQPHCPVLPAGIAVVCKLLILNWRREWDSFHKPFIIINKLLIPRCRECMECRLSRRALHAIARWRDSLSLDESPPLDVPAILPPGVDSMCTEAGRRGVEDLPSMRRGLVA